MARDNYLVARDTQYERLVDTSGATYNDKTDRMRLNYSKSQGALNKYRANSERINNLAYAGSVGLGIGNFLKPVFIGLLILLLVVGPGIIAISTLLTAAPWYLWVGGIIAGLFIVRSR